MPHPTPWHRWYGLERWIRRSRHQLRAHPLCAMCEARGLAIPARVADHVTPHRGDWNAFWLSPLQSLCHNCHNSRKRRFENCGYFGDIGEDGWPIDPRHPANAARPV